MNTHPTNRIDLPCIIVPKRHVDARGWFAESFQKKRLKDIGISCEFVQDNLTRTLYAGTLRGLHFQLPPAAQAKLVGPVHGRILDVAVDIRRGSPTYGGSISVELSAESGQQLYVPVGFAHGFFTLEDSVLVSYKVSDYYTAELDTGIRWNDPDVAFAWPAPRGGSDIMISDKDRGLPFLRGFSSPFEYDGHPLAAPAVVKF
jgi:dTDP-4-dehydrorhamnose 3,5-epimerase